MQHQCNSGCGQKSQGEDEVVRFFEFAAVSCAAARTNTTHLLLLSDELKGSYHAQTIPNPVLVVITSVRLADW